MFENVRSGAELTPRQETFVDALLTLPLMAASRAAKVSDKTGRLWLKQPAIQQALRAKRKQAAEHSLQGLLGLVDQAITTLGEAMTNEESPWPTRTRAAQIVLEQVDQRFTIAALEEQINELQALLKTEGEHGNDHIRRIS